LVGCFLFLARQRRATNPATAQYVWIWPRRADYDRLVHHVEVIALKGNSYGIKDRDLGRVPTVTADDQ
jgi:hypothetical protein